ncbi:hypothetical protein D3C72_1642010 [compost metagenome]
MRVHWLTSRYNFQANNGSFWTFDFCYGCIKSPANNVFEFTIFSLGYSNDFIIDMNALVFEYWSTRDNFEDAYGLVVDDKSCSDSFKRIGHSFIECLCKGRVKIRRMWVNSICQCLHDHLKSIVGIGFLCLRDQIDIAFF